MPIAKLKRDDLTWGHRVMAPIFSLLLLAACEQQKPMITSTGQPIARPQSTVTLEAGKSALEPTPLEPAPAPAPEVTPSSQSVDRYQSYGTAYRALRALPPPVISRGANGLPDPGSISAYTNALGARIGELNAQRQAIEATLAPSEKRAWKELQRSIQEGD